MAANQEPGAAAAPKTRTDKWAQFGVWVFLSVVSWIALADADAELMSSWKGMVLCLFALVAHVLAIICFLTAYYNWTEERAGNITTKTFLWIFGVPVGIIVAVLAYNWLQGALSGTPWWAIVIIVLLVAVLYELDKRR